MRQYQMALCQTDALIKELGGNFRDFNILKVEALLELNRPEDAYNLTNLMVCCYYYPALLYSYV